MLNWLKQAWVRHQLKREVRQERKRYYVVKTVTMTINWTDAAGKATIYYHLEENGYGERRCKACATGTGLWGLNAPKKYQMYQEVVYPWLTHSPTAIKTPVPENARLPATQGEG